MAESLPVVVPAWESYWRLLLESSGDSDMNVAEALYQIQVPELHVRLNNFPPYPEANERPLSQLQLAQFPNAVREQPQESIQALNYLLEVHRAGKLRLPFLQTRISKSTRDSRAVSLSSYSTQMHWNPDLEQKYEHVTSIKEDVEETLKEMKDEMLSKLNADFTSC